MKLLYVDTLQFPTSLILVPPSLRKRNRNLKKRRQGLVYKVFEQQFAATLCSLTRGLIAVYKVEIEAKRYPQLICNGDQIGLYFFEQFLNSIGEFHE